MIELSRVVIKTGQVDLIRIAQKLSCLCACFKNRDSLYVITFSFVRPDFW